MEQHKERMQRIRELVTRLETAINTSHGVREHAEALSQEVAELASTTRPERRSMPRLTLPVPPCANCGGPVLFASEGTRVDVYVCQHCGQSYAVSR
jgi:hypothetical protein